MVVEFFLVFTSRLEYSKLGRIYDNSNQICYTVLATLNVEVKRNPFLGHDVVKVIKGI